MSESKKQARLRAVAKGLKPTRLPTSEAEYRALLDTAATELTGKPPGHPEHDAIVNPRSGRPAKGSRRTSVLTAVRLPLSVAAAAKRKAKRQHRSLHAALRDAVTTWAMA